MLIYVAEGVIIVLENVPKFSKIKMKWYKNVFEKSSIMSAIIYPIIQIAISDPVTCPDKHTYEHKTIKKWVCNNFIDLGIQNYEGEPVEKFKEIFNELPPPEPSIHHETKVQQQCHIMNYYNNSSNPCFAGECMVEMADGHIKRVDQVLKGDRVQTEFGIASVYCVLKTHCREGKAELVNMSNGLRVTPYHPIKRNGNWIHPVTLIPSTRQPCQAVYSFLLDGHDHTMIINGTIVISLAHGRTEGILEHWYYGTRKVIDFLMNCPGWNDGLVQLRSGCIHTSKDDKFKELVYNF